MGCLGPSLEGSAKIIIWQGRNYAVEVWAQVPGLLLLNRVWGW